MATPETDKKSQMAVTALPLRLDPGAGGGAGVGGGGKGLGLLWLFVRAQMGYIKKDLTALNHASNLSHKMFSDQSTMALRIRQLQAGAWRAEGTPGS